MTRRRVACDYIAANANRRTVEALRAGEPEPSFNSTGVRTQPTPLSVDGVLPPPEPPQISLSAG